MQATNLYLNLFPHRDPWRDKPVPGQLTHAQKRTIKESKEGYAALAKRFGVPVSQIQKIRCPPEERAQRKADLDRRNRTIVQMVNDGKARKDVAKLFRVSVTTVNKLMTADEAE